MRNTVRLHLGRWAARPFYRLYRLGMWAQDVDCRLSYWAEVPPEQRHL